MHATLVAKQISISSATPVAIPIVVEYNTTPASIQIVNHATPVAKSIVINNATPEANITCSSIYRYPVATQIVMHPAPVAKQIVMHATLVAKQPAVIHATSVANNCRKSCYNSSQTHCNI